jgi:putative FmdB family regulatory protein
MPTYEYRCQECGDTFEFLQSFSDSPKRKCPACGRHRLKKLISGGAGLIFKGSGFYITDYRSADYDKAAKADKESGKSKDGDSAKDSKDSSEKSKDSKPAPKESSGDD